MSIVADKQNKTLLFLVKTILGKIRHNYSTYSYNVFTVCGVNTGLVQPLEQASSNRVNINLILHS